MRKRVVSLFLAAVLLLSSFNAVFASELTRVQETGEAELGSRWAEESLSRWTESGLLQGYPDGSVRPDHTITRAEFAALIDRLFRYAEADGAGAFTDVGADAWYAGPVERTVEAGIVSGYPDGTFRPSRPVTREQAAFMLMKAFKFAADSGSEAAAFTDQDAISKYALPAVRYFAERGYISGYPDGSFAPQSPLTRAAAASILDRIVGGWIPQAGEVGGVQAQQHVVINTPDVVLKDSTIEGNLYLTEGIGEGDVTLDNVVVKGTTYVNGGGANSVVIRDSELGAVVVHKKDGNVRIAASGATSVESVDFMSGGKLEELELTGEGFKNVALGDIGVHTIELIGEFESVIMNADVAIVITGTVAELTVNTDNAEVNGERVPRGAKLTVQDGKLGQVGASPSPTPAAPSTSTPPPDEDDWELIWSDEFDGSGTNLHDNGVDLDKWGFQNGTGAEYGLDGWGNQEQQYYTDENIRVEDGKLIIEAKNDGYGGKPYTSGRLWTSETFTKTYGKFEARMKLPVGQGFWPAFWMMPQDSVYGTWAASGELDIMEAKGRLPDRVGGAIHYGGTWPNNKFTSKDYEFPEGQSIAEYHTYAVEWEPGEIRWYVDGNLFSTINNWDSQGSGLPAKYPYPAPFDEDFYLILNLAIGGTFDGNRVPDPEMFPATMEVDYVRVYELTSRPYREPVEPVIEKEELPEGAKPAVDGNYVYDPAFNEDFTMITKDTDVLDPTYWNFAYIDTFGGTGSVSVDTIDDHRYAKIDIAQAGSQPHSIQLIQHVTLGKGRHYKVSFDAKAASSRTMTVKLGGGADRGWAAYSNNESIALTDEIRRYEFTFLMAQDSDPSARLEFNMGTNANSVWIGNVKIEETEGDPYQEDAAKEPLSDGNHVYNGTFDLGRQDRMTFWHLDVNRAAANGSVDADARELEVAIEDGGEDAEAIRLVQKGIQLLPTDQYQLAFNARASAARDIRVAWLSKDGGTVYHEQTFTLGSAMSPHAGTFTMPDTQDVEAQLAFDLGGSNHDVYLDDIVMTRLTNNNSGYTLEEIFPLKNGDFSNGMDNWAKHVQGEHDGWGSSAAFDASGQRMKISIGNIGVNPWDVQLIQDGMELVKGATYVVRFDARASKPRDMDVVVENASYHRYLDERASLTTETQTFSYEFAMGQDDTVGFKLLLGALQEAAAVDGAHDVFIDNIVLEIEGEREAVFPLTNGDFSGGLEGWGTHVQGNYDGDSRATISGDDHYAHVSVEHEGANPWDIQLFQEGLELKEGVTYSASFVARTDVPRTIEFIAENSGYHRYLNQPVALETGTQTYAFDFEMTADDTVSLKFLLAKTASPAGTAHNVFIDNVRFEVKGATEALGVRPSDDNDIEQPQPPILTADLDHNVLGQDVTITFTDNAAWRDAIEAVLVNGEAVDSSDYEVAAGAITLDASLFAEVGTYVIVVQSNGFEYAQVSQSIEAEQLWTLVWNDEFDGSGTNLSEGGVNLDKWAFQNGTGAEYGLDGWGNNEQQYYTEDNVKVEDGRLIIEAKNEAIGNKKYTSGRLWTSPTFAKTYGKFEARMKLPVGQGFWPAFWMMPRDSEYGTWAASGELDIMEAKGRLPDRVGGTIHHGGTWPNNKYTGAEYEFPEGQSIADYHTYAVEWEPGEIRWYVDGVLYQTLNNWDSQGSGQPTKFAYPAPFDKEFYIILNLAVGGTFDGGLEPDASMFPATMEVDYVRVYELTGRPYREAVEPVIEPEEMPEGAKMPIDGNYIYDPGFEQPITDVATGATPVSTQYWNFVHLDTFGGSGTASVDVVDGKRYAKVEISQPGSQPHSIQLIQNVTLTKGRYYEVSFDAKAASNRSMTVKLGGGEPRGYAAYSNSESFALTDQFQTFKFKFQMKAESDPLARLEMNMGTNGTTVWIGNVKVAESDGNLLDENGPKAPLESGEHVYNGNFNLGAQHRMTYWNFDVAEAAQAEASVNVDEGHLHVAVTDGGANPEYVQLVQKGMNLLQKDRYKLSFAARADEARTIRYALLSKDGSENYTGYRTVNLTDAFAEHDFEFAMPEGVTDTEGQLAFQFGGSGADVYLKNVSMIRLTNHNVDYSKVELFPLKNGEFDLGLAGWEPFMQGGTASFGTENGEAKIEITNKGTEAWNVMLNQSNMPFTKGLEYVFSFDARSSVERNIEVSLENSAYTRQFQTGLITISPETKHFEYTFKVPADESLALKFQLGNTPNSPSGAHQLYFDNVVLEVKGAPVKRPPTLVPDTTDNMLGQPIEITFTDNAEWRGAIQSVKANDAVIPADMYAIEAGKITIEGAYFTQDSIYSIVVESDGYANATTNQQLFPSDGNLVLNGSFSAGAASWEHWTGDGGNSTFQVESGEAAVRVENNGGLHWEWNIPVTWSTQLTQSNIQLEAGKSYELSFKSRASANRPIEVEYNGRPGDPKKIFRVTTEAASYSDTFTAAGNEVLDLKFLLGNVIDGDAVTPSEPHSIYLDDIAIREVLLAPTLHADSSFNNSGQPIAIMFTDNADWRTGITEISVTKDDISVTDATYFNIAPGVITIHPSAFSGEGQYTVAVKSNGYPDASVQQMILGDLETSVLFLQGGSNPRALSMVPGAAAGKDILPQDLSKVTYQITNVAGHYHGSGTASANLHLNGLAVAGIAKARLSYDFDGDGTWDRTEETGTMPTDGATAPDSYEAFARAFNEAVTGSGYQTMAGGNIMLELWLTSAGLEGGANGEVKVNDPDAANASNITLPYTLRIGSDPGPGGGPTPEPEPVPVNLALNQSAASSDLPVQPAANAVDGNPGTRWESASSDPQWIQVDLGSETSVGRVVLNWEGAFATAYEIRTSIDGTEWEIVYSTTTGDGGLDEIAFDPVTARFVQMLGTVRGTPYGYSLWELEVYR